MKTFILPAVFALTAACWQSAKAQVQHSGWLASFHSIKTGAKTSIHFDGQLRSTDELQQVQSILIRPGLNYHLSNRLTLTFGYGFISNRRSLGTVSGLLPEHRIWQQALYQHPLAQSSLSHRLRLEQRFISKAVEAEGELKASGYFTTGRLRYFVRSLVPFNSSSPFTRGAFGALQNEVFVNVAAKNKVNGKFFDQNRLYLALGYRIQPKIDLEIGYLNQYISGAGTWFTNNHVAQVASYFRL